MFDEEEETVCRLSCQHMFHKGCLEEWFQRASNCPVCRHSMNETEGEHGVMNAVATSKLEDEAETAAAENAATSSSAPVNAILPSAAAAASSSSSQVPIRAPTGGDNSGEEVSPFVDHNAFMDGTD